MMNAYIYRMSFSRFRYYAERKIVQLYAHPTSGVFFCQKTRNLTIRQFKHPQWVLFYQLNQKREEFLYEEIKK